MANIVLDSEKLFKTLDRLEKTPRINLMLVGRHGIGKSEILTKYYQDKGMKVVTFFLGQMSDPGDLIGLPRLNEETGRTEFMPPFWWPTDNQPIVLFLDELNRARPEILQVVMDLCLNKRLAGRSLPEGSRIVSAVNGGDEYIITELDPALKSRFAIAGFNPSVLEWVKWAEAHELDQRVVDFIHANEQMLDGVGQSSVGLDKTPDRRAWTMVSDVLKGEDELTEDLLDVISSLVGVAAAGAFSTWLRENHLPSAEDILKKPFSEFTKKLLRLELQELSTVTTSIFKYLNAHANDADMKDISKNVLKYVKLLTTLPTKGVKGRNQSLEPFAFFSESFMAPENADGSTAVLSYSDEIVKVLQTKMNRI